MKKIITVCIVLVILLSVSVIGFFGFIMKTDDEVKQSGKKSKTRDDEEVSFIRTEDISEGIENYSLFNYKYDFDFDGKKENVFLKIIPSEEYDEGKMEISIGEYKKEVDVYDGCIDKVYACDIDIEDGVRDLAIITNEVSGDPRIRILKYDKDLSAYNFYIYDEYMQNGETSDDNWLGYACSYYFNVNDDGTITLEEQTPSAGMWSVYKTYYINKDGNFVEKKPEHYEILSDFMQNNYGLDEMDNEEKRMWKDGYVKAYIDFESNGFEIKEGEYFKIMYDNGNDMIYVEKESGEAGWISIDYTTPGRYELNEYYFYLAG